jgi:hypothetical protein
MIKIKRVHMSLNPQEWIMLQQAVYNASGTDVKDGVDNTIQLVRNRLALNNQAYIIEMGDCGQCLNSDGNVSGSPGDWTDFYYDWDPRFKYGESLEAAYEKLQQLHEAGLNARVKHWGCGWRALAEHGYGEVDEDISPLQFMIKIRHAEDSDLLQRATSLNQAKRFRTEDYPEANMISLEISLDLDGKGECSYVVADWDYREEKR